MSIRENEDRLVYFKNLMEELLRMRDDFMQYRQSLDQADYLEANDLEHALNSTIQKASTLRMIFYCKCAE